MQTKYQFIIDYWKQGYSVSQISDLSGLTIKKVRQLHNYLRLKANYHKVVETSEFKQFMLGSLLGDGSIAKLGKHAVHYGLSFGHGEKQLDYLKWKNLFLKKFDLASGVITKVISVSNRYKSGKCISYHFKSFTNPIFTSYRSIFYPKGVKLVPDVVSDLDEFGLAIWFMDDGYKVIPTDKHNPFYCLSSCGFTKKDNLKLVKILKSNFDINSSVISGGFIKIARSSTSKFTSLVKPHLLDIFKYKIINGPV